MEGSAIVRMFALFSSDVKFQKSPGHLQPLGDRTGTGLPSPRAIEPLSPRGSKPSIGHPLAEPVGHDVVSMLQRELNKAKKEIASLKKKYEGYDDQLNTIADLRNKLSEARQENVRQDVHGFFLLFTGSTEATTASGFAENESRSHRFWL